MMCSVAKELTRSDTTDAYEWLLVSKLVELCVGDGCTRFVKTSSSCHQRFSNGNQAQPPEKVSRTKLQVGVLVAVASYSDNYCCCCCCC